jgi:2-hydroxychromene-2-carboxylate isomerase
MKTVDVYWSFRSPYSYFSVKRLRALSQTWAVDVRPRPVYPLAIRDDNFFAGLRPQWIPYLLRDIVRVAQFEGLPFGPLNPDPVVQNMVTREISPDQPHIHRLTRLGILACEAGNEKGWAFLDEVSSLIWSGGAWAEGSALSDAAVRAGFDLAEMDTKQVSEKERLTQQIEVNQAEQDKHHWGVPLMVYQGEAFFGQDRIELLEWRLEQDGIKKRAGD